MMLLSVGCVMSAHKFCVCVCVCERERERESILGGGGSQEVELMGKTQEVQFMGKT